MADKKKRRGQDEEPEAVDNAAPVTPDLDDDDLDREPERKCLHDDHDGVRQIRNRGSDSLGEQDPSEQLHARVTSEWAASA